MNDADDQQLSDPPNDAATAEPRKPDLDRHGPWTALVFPTVVATAGAVIVTSACSDLECLAQGVFGLFLLISGLPTLVVTGPVLARGALPVAIALAVVTSIPLWWLVGRWLARRDMVRSAERPWLVLGVLEAAVQIGWTAVAIAGFVVLARAL